ncbi:MAG: ShlB/FhaC/HecB family hemolysin secretion/activation protein, partial [Symploca sp. SIO2G7]|nr:ShlB/FhaC/HecB family hemolysin secretion/activation protein [Symploca sp. SIO2G7]
RGQTQWVSLIAPETLLILKGDVQLATQSLLRLEQFGMGGADTVRGYRQNTFISDNGLLASAEVRIPIVRFPELEGLLQIAPFVDFGAIWNQSGNPDPDPDPNVLVSTGIGLRLRLGDRLSARFDWGIPLVDVPTSDRTLQEEGLYFSLTYQIY